MFNDANTYVVNNNTMLKTTTGPKIRMCFPFIGDDAGGSHISALKLIENLDGSVFEPFIVLHQTDGLLAGFLRERGHDFSPVPQVSLPQAGEAGGRMETLRSAIRYLTTTLPQLRKFLRSQRVDILHTNDGRTHALWSPAAWNLPTKYVWHHRGDPTARATNILAPLFADHIVTVSRFARPAKPIRNIDRRWSVVHSPFEHPVEHGDAETHRQRLIEEIGCQDNARFLGYFGLLMSRKRPNLMADIVHAYKERYPSEPVHAVLFGRPTETTDRLDESVVIARAKELGVADRVHLMGFRNPIEPWMRAVDVNLVPAVNEPFGRTLIESMLLGTPVVATDHGGNPEAIEDGVNGFLVEAEDPAAFVKPVHRLLQDPSECRRISETARSMALENYGISKHVRSISDIYFSLVGAPAATTAGQVNAS